MAFSEKLNFTICSPRKRKGFFGPLKVSFKLKNIFELEKNDIYIFQATKRQDLDDWQFPTISSPRNTIFLIAEKKNQIKNHFEIREKNVI